ncbi:MAG: biopolymer transporter ExbD [Bacteriovoracaceae bacterium]|nr:biopolymer transporter ExbD [Bacteriovoracaceae bacterium]
MLRKKKNKHPLPEVELNITSLMDILTTLLFFILMVMTFSNLSILKGTSQKSGTEMDDKKKLFALKIEIENDKKAEIFLGPLTELKMVNERDLLRFLNNQYQGSRDSGFSKVVYGKDTKQLFDRIQDAVKGIKHAFPHENKVVIAYTDKVEYQTVIYSIQALKQLAEAKEAMELTTLVGTKEKTRVLFPEIILAEK